jgi:hypothetical protein
MMAWYFFFLAIFWATRGISKAPGTLTRSMSSSLGTAADQRVHGPAHQPVGDEIVEPAGDDAEPFAFGDQPAFDNIRHAMGSSSIL